VELLGEAGPAQTELLVHREVLIDPDTGGQVDPSFGRAVPQMMPFTELPPLWATVQKWYWDAAAGTIVQLPG
jgi:hypothetical protein